ncbi:hypothetical protein KMP13_18955 [Epibacterium ulvae]|uniref:hypothetical protein n=1 Tax=Epibacterium ulvae TaxID=1156985 RepID=UPI001BFC7E0C|nr:hypothetical protein [Epibacterium ulvae]MBT8155901.1 hypothetical protein [Epibacterium ulvae]
MTSKLIRFFVLSILAVSICSPGSAQQHLLDLEKEIRKRFDEKTANNAATCTKARKELRRMKRSGKYEPYHFVFAGRKDNTITGIFGCGYAWNVSLEAAQVLSMARCRKWERELGVGNGEKTCRYLD